MSANTHMRVCFIGQICTETALHIGTGSNLNPATDAPILLNAFGTPFVPGSSLKGAMRSASERLLRSLGQRACLVFGDEVSSDAGAGGPNNGVTACLTTDPFLRGIFQKLRRNEKLSRSENEFAQKEWRLTPEEQRNFRDREDLQRAVLEKHAALCRACLTWGSHYMAGRIRIPDLSIVPRTWVGATEIRDGVGIDRDTGTAAEHIKFDLQVLPAGAAFSFELIVEPEGDLAVAALAVGELVQGAIALGGRTTRGLGQISLKDLAIYEIDFNNAKSLITYLTQGKEQARIFRDTAACLRLQSYLEPLIQESQHAA